LSIRSTLARILAVVLAAGMLLVPAASAVAAPPKPVAPKAAGAGVGSPVVRVATQPDGRPCELDCDPHPCFPEYEYCDSLVVYCLVSISKSVTRGSLEDGTTYSRIAWNGQWNCTRNYYALHVQITGQTALVDRSAGNSGNLLGVGGYAYGQDNASSSGVAYLYDDEFESPAGQQVEVTFDTTLTITGVHPAHVWTGCNPMPSGARYVEPCQGIGTQSLWLLMGSNSFSTGVTAAQCYPENPSLQFTDPTNGQVIAKITAHLQWCRYSNGRIKEVKRTAPAELYKNPGSSYAEWTIQFDAAGDPERGWTESDGRGHYQVTANIGRNGKFFPWCHMTIHGVYIGANADHSEDMNNCSVFTRNG
jgi:hypothetical protein